MQVDPYLSPQHRFLEVAQVAHRLNFTPRVVWNLIRTGKLPAYRFESRYRVKEADLLAYVEGQKVQVTREEAALDRRFRTVHPAKDVG